MENATNGLIMAGSVLIGVIVLSLFVYLFSSMGTTAKEFQEEMDKTSVLKFNEPFEKYMGREDLTPHDVLTIYNLVKERNQEAGYDIIDINDPGSVGWILYTILNYIKIIGPILVVLLSAIDFIKAVVGFDEKAMKEAQSKLVIRLVAAICLFLVPTLVQLLLSFINATTCTLQ